MVIDAVGKSSFGRCKRVLRPRGIYLSSDLGPLSQNPLLALITPLFGGKRVMFPIPPNHGREEMGYLKEMIESGAFRPVIDRRYPLDRIVEAYEYVETGQQDRQRRDHRAVTYDERRHARRLATGTPIGPTHAAIARIGRISPGSPPSTAPAP